MCQKLCVMNFLDFFINKINDIRLGIFPPAFDPSVFSVDFSQFEPISFLHLQEIVCPLKPSGSSIDFIPPYFLKQVFDTVKILSITVYLVTMINRCFETSSMPSFA